MTRLPDIELGLLPREEIAWAASIAARAMRDNPMSLAVFGDNPAVRLKALEPTFSWTLSLLRQPALVARRRGVIVGLVSLATPDQCFFRQMMARRKTVRLGGKEVGFAVPAIPRRVLLPMLRMGPGGMGRLSKWSDAIATHDPEKQHQHIELVAVEPALQGLGVGRLMMERICREMESRPGMPYLETDTQENVRFYEQLGFEVLTTEEVLGATNWYMGRPPAEVSAT